MNCLVVRRAAGILESRTFQKTAQVFERDSAVDLNEGPLDDVLQLERVDRSRTAEGEEVAPGVGGEPPPLVGSHDSECHRNGQSVIHSWVTYDASIRVQARGGGP